MREILHRGKRTDNGEWIEGYYVHLRDSRGRESHRIYTGYAETDCGDFYPDWFEVDPDTVGKYVGMPDKNGKRIFEGDILLFGTRKLVVWWNDEAFQWQAKERQTYPCITFDGKQTIDVVWDNIDLGWIAAEVPCVGKMTTGIIGNIHDNPELLENP